MYHPVIRATTKLLEKSWEAAPIVCKRHFRATKWTGRSAQGGRDQVENNQQGFTLHGIRSLNEGESNYVKFMRMEFTLHPSGRKRTWDCVKAHDSVACVIYNKTRNKLIYVKQFRPAVYLSSLSSKVSDLADFDPTKLEKSSDTRTGYSMELCAGLADKRGKTPKQTVREEIMEETGYEVPLDSIQFVCSFRGSTGLSGTLMNLFFVEVSDDQKTVAGGGVDGEVIEVLEFDIEDARKAIYCRDDEAPYSRPPAMLFGTCWFLYEYLPQRQTSGN